MSFSSAETLRLPETSRETVEALSGMRSRMATENPEAHVEAVLRSGSDALEREQRERAKAEWASRAQGVIGGFGNMESSLGTELGTYGFPEAIQADLERTITAGARSPYDGEANPYFQRFGNSRGSETPNVRINVDAIEAKLKQIETYRQMPGVTSAQLAALDQVAGQLGSIKDLDPLAVRMYQGHELQRNSPHMKFAGKLGKFAVLAIGLAAGLFGVAGTVTNFLSDKEEDRKPSPFLFGPLAAWAALNWKSLNTPSSVQVAEQVSTLNNPRLKNLLADYGATSPDGFADIAEAVTANPNSVAIRKLLADPGNPDARREVLDELMPQGTDEQARMGLATMMADGRFADFHSMLKNVKNAEAKEFIAAYIRTEGYAGLRPGSVRPPSV